MEVGEYVYWVVCVFLKLYITTLYYTLKSLPFQFQLVLPWGGLATGSFECDSQKTSIYIHSSWAIYLPLFFLDGAGYFFSGSLGRTNSRFPCGRGVIDHSAYRTVTERYPRRGRIFPLGRFALARTVDFRTSRRNDCPLYTIFRNKHSHKGAKHCATSIVCWGEIFLSVHGGTAMAIKLHSQVSLDLVICYVPLLDLIDNKKQIGSLF